MCVWLIVALAVLAQQPETMSLLGEPLFAPKLPKAERAAAEAELARAQTAYNAKPSGAAEIVALARAHRTLGRIGDAIVILTRGVEANPDAPDLLLERGDDYIVIRKFPVAARDFSKAVKLPAARCGLALAQYLDGDYQRSRTTYKDCAQPGVFAYLAERRAGGAPPERPVPDGPIAAATPAIRFPGTVTKESAAAPEPLSAMYLSAIERLLDGKTDDARDRLKKIVERHRGDWMQPAYIAAEADYERLQKPRAERRNR
jgi:tetratricopeptide (TPR) repeat protein